MTILIYVEGQTEEQFVKNCLAPYLLGFGIFMTPIVVNTKTLLSGAKVVGGLTNGNIDKFLKELRKLMNSIEMNGIVTTFIDFYGIPSNFPGYSHLTADQTVAQKIDVLNAHLHEYYEMNIRFVPFIMMHEFEALLFSHPIGFENILDPSLGNVDGLKSIIENYDNPELINGSRDTSPSHRIINHYPKFKKPLLGNMVILEIGIEQILAKCPRFKDWVDVLISRKQ